MDRSRRWVRAALALVLGVASIAAALLTLDRRFPPPLDPDLELSTQVLDHQGRWLRVYTTADGYWRLPTHLDSIDPGFIDKLVATEDRRFFRHRGVDPLALARALGQALAAGRIVSGGSTLTMQTARLLEPRPRTFTAKAVEMLRALQIERRLDKRAILGLYLTLAPYGGNLQGIEAATRFYFGKPAIYLTLDEVALLIVLPQAPEARRPDRNPERALEARDSLLERWEHRGTVPSASAATARGRPVPVLRFDSPRLAAHFADRVRGDADTGGVVRTTLDADLQRRAEVVLARRQALLPRAHTVAALLVEHRSGEVRAWLGSGDYLGRGFPGQVDMVSAVRSPGSLLKPFIYSLAFDREIAHPQTLVADRADALQTWRPSNFDQRFEGEMTLAEALARSRNVPAVQMLERVGVEALLDLLARAGVATRLPSGAPAGLAVGLGGLGVSMLDIASLYGAVGADGLAQPPRGLASSEPARPKRLMGEHSAWYIAQSLLHTPRPAARWPDSRPIAVKTGTSFAYRDAWAAGVDGRHTVVVWMGRPDGGHTPGFTGVDQAVPLLLDLFALLPEPHGHWPGPHPAGALWSGNGSLPEGWRRFDPQATGPSGFMHVTDGPRIVFPPTGALLTWDPSDPELSFEARGGEAPYTWLANGHPVAVNVDTARRSWAAPSAGEYRITLLDRRGRSSAVDVRVQDSGDMD